MNQFLFRCKALFLALFVSTFVVFAKPVSKDIAQKVCANHFSTVTNAPSNFLSTSSDVSLVLEKKDKKNQSVLYVFSVKNNGYTIIAGDDRVTPILGYSYEGNVTVSVDKFPPQMKALLEYYASIVSDVSMQPEPNAITSTQKEWELLISDKKTEDRFTVTSPVNVPSLIKSTWDQGDPYNKFCPRDQNGEQAVVGCVATAMAMIMHYHQYPERGTGFNSFQLQGFGTISANFSNFTYNWSAMPNSITTNSSTTAIDQVARISFHCGVATNMMYGVAETGGSGTYSHLVSEALIKYFGYDKDATKYVEKSDYSDSQWSTLLQTELNNNRPLYYSGASSGGGHAFILDGYSGNFFSVNWGWSGVYNGNFLLTNLTPDGTGIGGGAGSYNFGQAAVLIKPPVSGGGGGGGGTDPSANANIQISSAMQVTPSPLVSNGSITVTTNVVNKATSTFEGSLSAALFTSTGEFVKFIEVKENISLPTNYTFTNPITFTNATLFGVPAGDYLVAVYFKSTGSEWQIASKAQHPNVVSVSIEDPVYSNVLTLYDGDIEVPNVVQLETPFQVRLNLQNTSQSTFEGDYSVDLMDAEGNYLEELSKIENVSLPQGYVYTNKLTFNVDGLTGIEPGTYYIAAWFKPLGGEWDLVNPGQYANPKEFTVLTKALVADAYEPNNTTQSASGLQLVDNSACLYISSTNNGNLHNNSDVDYYTITMPSQCQYYNVSITAEDIDASSNYSADVIFTHNFTSDVFDVEPSNFVLASGENLRIKVEPYFPGQTGTYKLLVNLTPSSTSSVATLPSLWSISPNPAKDLTVLSSATDIQITEVIIRDISGKVVMTLKNQTTSTSFPINVETLANGQYVVEVLTATNEKHTTVLNVVR